MWQFQNRLYAPGKLVRRWVSVTFSGAEFRELLIHSWMAKDTYWFRHDSNASRDPKILEMKSIWGYEGYGLFWAIIEYLREQEDYKLKVSEKYGFRTLAGALSCDSEKLQSFVMDLVNEFDLLRFEDGFLWSDSLINRMQRWEANKANGRKGGRPKKPKQNPTQNRNKTQPKTETKALREEKRREEDRREEKNIRNVVPPQKIWVWNYTRQYHWSKEECGKFYDHHEARGWILSNSKKARDWQAMARTWESNRNKFGSNRNESSGTGFVRSHIPNIKDEWKIYKF